ncbi:N-6 DNA methylase, partial [Microbacterium sp. AISO3]|uniref:N-6 DNA methylase n=1 Tax=Microbacterium sp. AISO3 TaxID=2002831 RepID=UPI0018D4C771
MAIFFNEFTRYKGKSEQGQVFTPDHITSLIYRITGTCHKDNVLDACCGSGSFLTKAMSYMISEVGGISNEAAVLDIKKNRLFGIE